MLTLHHHEAEFALCRLAGLIEDRAAQCGGDYDPVLDDLERDFAEIRCLPRQA
jgi:hypothetical protein